MQLTDYFENLIDPFFAILDLALERPLAFGAFAATAVAGVLALV